MRKIYKLISAIVLPATMLFACSDDYLETDITEFLSDKGLDEAAKYNPDLLNGSVAGLYTLMINRGTGGTTGHDDIGQKGYDIYSDLLSGDMVLTGVRYGWYEDVTRMKVTVNYSETENYRPWRYYYRIIFNANIIIDASVDENGKAKNDDVKHNLGQAKAMRAYAYYYLANLYANEYNPSEPTLPLYTTVSDEAEPLATGKEVYDTIIQDLEDAKMYLADFERGNEAGDKNIVNKDVVNGLLAYVYATTGDYAKAVAAADAVISSSKYPILPKDELTSNGFNNVSTPSWIWGFDIKLANDLDLRSWWGQMDIYTYSYAMAGDRKGMDHGLYKSIRDTDGRKDQFAASGGQYLPINKFYHPERKVGGQGDITTDYVYMRIEEMYLLKAEASAKAGDDATAKAALLELVSKRDSDPSYVSSLSGQALKDEIYKQLRIELWGEGKSYLAMKRNKATITREGHLFENISVPYNDDRLTMEIPIQEIQNNPHL
ncbi:membrane protein [Fulvitalea axinellae]|uniref:Membrane protein n=1 Tax=Fulvitalea axinellae TaxID=1182444 RepID=A0AAU9CKM9_9BACT|nr:membrane protein [Fulvitalea axinellae]